MYNSIFKSVQFDFAIIPDGSLYISESKRGKIWRVLFTGDKEKYGKKELDQMENLKSKSYLKIPDEKTDNLFSKN